MDSGGFYLTYRKLAFSKMPSVFHPMRYCRHSKNNKLHNFEGTVLKKIYLCVFLCAYKHTFQTAIDFTNFYINAYIIYMSVNSISVWLVSCNVPFWFPSQETNGYSGSDIKLVCKEAAMRPVRKIFDALENHQPGTSALSRESGKCWFAAVTLGTNILTPAGGALIPVWKTFKLLFQTL